MSKYTFAAKTFASRTFASNTWAGQPIIVSQLPRPYRPEHYKDLNALWWEQYPGWASRYVPAAPATFQPSQRYDDLPSFQDLWWRQHYTWPIPVQYIPTPPPLRQPNQRVDPLPDYWQEWHPQKQTPLAQWFVPPLPPSRQSDQRWDVLPVLDFLWYEQKYHWAIPVPYIPTPPPTHQPSQRWDDLPSFYYIWWEQKKIIPLPGSFLVSQEGAYGVVGNIILAAQTGNFRVQNNIEGYIVFVGSGSEPDLTQPPAYFSASLPITFALTPPGSGTETFYILVRRQDTYGLQSQNQHYTTITLDSHGNQVLPPVNGPSNLQLFQQPGGNIRILANYAGFGRDPYPATSWKVWAGVVPPNTGNQPIKILPAAQTLTTQIGSFSPGLRYVSVALYRATDNTLSTVLTGSLTINTSPGEVVAVPSGFDVEP